MSLTAKRPSKGDAIKAKMMEDVMENEGKARLNADIEKSLYKRIKMQSVEEGRSISDITREIWIAYLNK